jgi:Rap1a immunity proteins
MARGLTVRCGVVFAIATFYPAVSPAQTQIDAEARLVTAGCHEAIRNACQQSFDAGMCLGIIKGLHYLSRDVCIPPATSLAEIADIVSRYVDSHKGKTQDDFRETSLEAMRSAWPCGKKHDI